MDVESTIKSHKPDISNSSARAYSNSLRKLNKDVFEGEPFTNFKWLLKIDEIMKYLKTKKYLTMRNYLNAVIVGIQTMDKYDQKILDQYVVERDKGNLQYDKFVETNKKSEKEDKNWISFEEIEKIRKSLDKKDTYAQYVFLTLFMEYVTRNDFRALYKTSDRALKKIKKEQLNSETHEKINYFVKYKSGFYILLESFKTSAKYDPIKIEIDEKYNKMINRYLRMTKFNKYLFEKNGSPFDTKEFTLWVENIFKSTGKKVGTTLLRHIIISHNHGDAIKKQKEDARVAGHSAKMQSNYVRE